MERLDLSYRTGIKLTAEEMQKTLLKEFGYAGLLSVARKKQITEYNVVQRAAYDGTLHNLWKGKK
jgi:hypothetical protein